jgi:GTP-binding protein
VAAISAATGDGIADLRAHLAALLPGADELGRPPEPAGVVVHRLDAAPGAARVSRDPDGAYRVAGRRVERLAAQTDFGIEESAERFQRDLERLGVDARLRDAGIKAGDTVRIGAVELEWAPELWTAGR